jgi:hypothetical protein
MTPPIEYLSLWQTPPKPPPMPDYPGPVAFTRLHFVVDWQLIRSDIEKSILYQSMVAGFLGREFPQRQAEALAYIVARHLGWKALCE